MTNERINGTPRIVRPAAGQRQTAPALPLELSAEDAACCGRINRTEAWLLFCGGVFLGAASALGGVVVAIVLRGG